MTTLPFVSPLETPILFDFRASPADFEVEEIPAYLPSGEGSHIYVWLEKTGLSTADAAGAIGKLLDVSPRDVGYAGMKDKWAVTRQWMSFPNNARMSLEEVRTRLGSSLEVPSGESKGKITVLRCELHGNKLRTGHLHGNIFKLLLRNFDLTRLGELRRLLTALGQTGLPNYYGEQRFGRQNLERALGWINGPAAPPRDKTKKKFDVSVVQSWLFNQTLAARITDGLFVKAVDGDLYKREDSGGLFTTTDLIDAQTRLDLFAISATGPMFGAKMRWPENEAKRREEEVLSAAALPAEFWNIWRDAGDGTRRPFRVRLEKAEVSEIDGTTVGLAFSLPAGAYATTLLRELHRDQNAKQPVEGAPSDVVLSPAP